MQRQGVRGWHMAVQGLGQVSLPCVRCGRPASASKGGEHHHPHKGMGGQGVKVPEHGRVPLCRDHHTGPEGVHNGAFAIELVGDIARTMEGGVCASRRAVVVREEDPDPSYWSDEKLAAQWRYSEENALDALFDQCQAAWLFYERYHWQPQWYDRVAEMLSEYSGRFVHPRRVYERVKVWEAFRDRREDYEYLGTRVAIAVAEDPDHEKALGYAILARDDGARSAEIVEALRAKRQEREYLPAERHECPLCHNLHRIQTRP